MRVIGDDGIAVDFDPSGVLTDNSVTNAYLANMNDDRIKGRTGNSGVAGDPQDLTQSQVRSFLGLLALAYKATIGTSDIDNDSVTFAKMQNAVNTARMLGRFSAGTGDYEEGDQSTVRTFLGLAALAYKATISTGDIDNDAVTLAKMVNVSAAGRVWGRKTTSAGAGDAEELIGSDVRSILGTLDADTLNGVSASTLQTNILNAIRDGVGTAYDTLLEIYNQMASDESAVSALITTVSGKNKLGVSVNLGTSSADAVHNHNLGTTDVIAQLKRNSDGKIVPCPTVVTDANNVTYLLDAAPTTGQWRSTVIPLIA